MADREVILKAADLARSRPQEWAAFVAALDTYTTTIRDQCISSPLDVLPVAQGRAQQCVALLRLLENCVKAADQILEKKR